MRRKFFMRMWLLYMAIVGISTIVAVIRYAIGDDGSLHHFISMTSNHLVLVRPMQYAANVSFFRNDGHGAKMLSSCGTGLSSGRSSRR